MVVYTKPPEGGWGWMVVLGAHVIQAFTAGQVSCMGLFLVEWLEEFNASVSTTSWIVSIVSLLTGCVSPISNVLAQKFGHRTICCIGSLLVSLGSLLSAFATNLTHLYLSFGVLLGVGCGLIYAPSIMVTGIYFRERFALANSMTTAGACIGSMALPPVFNYLISIYGWRMALIVISAINMHLFVASCLFRPLQIKSMTKKKDTSAAANDFELQDVELEETDNQQQRKGTRLVQCCSSVSKATGIPELCYTPHYPIAVFVAFTIGATFYCTLVYITPRVLQYGYTKNDAALLLFLFGIGNLGGRFIHGILIDLKYASTHTVCFISLVINAISVLLSPLTSKFVLLGLFLVVYGISMGIISPLIFVIAREVAPSHLLAPVIGFTVLLYAGGNTFGTVFGGWLFDISSDYGVLFYASGGMMAFATILFIPTAWWLHKRKSSCE
ncbi:monocarboxylate transporter 12-like [Amphiura filiformis]|uniref:monocarboxylate transporter 12-like n=1 Tax=Amphiura filiformis TaxID=82378 RepID=UPI003B20D51D